MLQQLRHGDELVTGGTEFADYARNGGKGFVPLPHDVQQDNGARPHLGDDGVGARLDWRTTDQPLASHCWLQ